MIRLELLTRPGYQFKVQWECEFDDAGIVAPVLLSHLTECRSPLCTRDALYVDRNEAMHLHYKAREGETISM